MTRLTAAELRTVRAGLAAGEAADGLRAAMAHVPTDALVPIDVRGVTARVPSIALHMLIELLEDMSEGREVTIAPVDVLVGTGETARLLGVSRTWVAQLVDNQKLAAVRHGTKRRIPLGAIIKRRRAYAERMRKAIDELNNQQQQQADAPHLEAQMSHGVLVGQNVNYTTVPEFGGEYVRELLEQAKVPDKDAIDEPSLAA